MSLHVVKLLLNHHVVKVKLQTKRLAMIVKQWIKKASERVRLAIANNEISAEEGRVRLAKLNEKKKN